VGRGDPKKKSKAKREAFGFGLIRHGKGKGTNSVFAFDHKSRGLKLARTSQRGGGGKPLSMRIPQSLNQSHTHKKQAASALRACVALALPKMRLVRHARL
jgi:hypothetical protein